MKKFSWLIIVFLIAFACGYSSVALSGTEYKVAVVDVQSLAVNSSEVKSLSQSRKRKWLKLMLLWKKHVRK